MAVSNLQQRLVKAFKQYGRKPVTLKLLEKTAKVKKHEYAQFREILSGMKNDGKIIEKNRAYVWTESLGWMCGQVVKVTEYFGFAKVEGMESDLFLPGRLMKGAMPGDTVMLKQIPGRGERPEAEVVKILNAVEYRFTGVAVRDKQMWMVIPDKGTRMEIRLEGEISGISAGDRVLARISRRGDRHYSHRAELLEVFGKSSSSAASCEAVLAAHDVVTEFSQEAIEQAKELQERGIHPKEIAQRLDLRDEIIFTIDGADSKDLDDAVSIEKTPKGWKLGVHIADVSYYVGSGTAVDKEAYERATSIYYADKVVPMLPRELSNGICSLNPGEDRLAFSALMELDERGKLVNYRFAKTIIRSVVKGVYSEINSILSGKQTEEIEKKYEPVIEKIALMQQLADILTANRFARGGMDLESAESKIIMDENGKPVDVQPRERGVSERIIEEFMLTANTACACFGIELDIPFIFRVHENPPDEKLARLSELLRSLGLSVQGIEHKPSQHKLSQVLDAVKGTKLEMMVNNQMLRTMAKAEYSSKNIGHYGLVLDNYTHFTSPIRRYPDLIAHRELTLMLTGGSKEKLCRRYEKYLPEACDHCTSREIRAMQIERECEDCCKAEYILAHVGEEFDGVISSITSFGIYVQLPNTVEGMIRIDSLPEGEYIFDELTTLEERYSGETYRVG
ncbi:MAG: ribonuclease R, partial [Oscillospiraceae bacterium]|nr:ribonuclease R [Oscillospiraceae bacterium]